jgi:hypothetical protein
MTTFQVSLFVNIFIGGAIGGYFIVFKSPARSPAIGLVTGALSYIINVIYSIVLYGRYMILTDYLSFTGFFLGGLTGAVLRNRSQIARARRSRTP